MILVVTNYYSSIFVNVTWHLQPFLFNLRPHTQQRILRYLLRLPATVLTIIRPWPLALTVPELRISVLISRLPSAPVISRFVPAAISAEPYRKALISKLFFRQILSLADATYISRSAILWQPSPCIFHEHGIVWEKVGSHCYLYPL